MKRNNGHGLTAESKKALDDYDRREFVRIGVWTIIFICIAEIVRLVVMS